MVHNRHPPPSPVPSQVLSFRLPRTAALVISRHPPASMEKDITRQIVRIIMHRVERLVDLHPQRHDIHECKRRLDEPVQSGRCPSPLALTCPLALALVVTLVIILTLTLALTSTAF